MKSLCGKTVEIENNKNHYRGTIVNHLFKSGKIDVKISEVLKGDLIQGKTIKTSLSKCKSISA